MYGSVKSQFSDCRELFAVVGRTIMASTIVALAVLVILLRVACWLLVACFVWISSEQGATQYALIAPTHDDSEVSPPRSPSDSDDDDRLGELKWRCIEPRRV